MLDQQKVQQYDVERLDKLEAISARDDLFLEFKTEQFEQSLDNLYLSFKFFENHALEDKSVNGHNCRKGSRLT